MLFFFFVFLFQRVSERKITRRCEPRAMTRNEGLCRIVSEKQRVVIIRIERTFQSKSSSGYAYAYGWNVYYEKLLGICWKKNEKRFASQRAWCWASLMGVCIWLPQTASLRFLWGDLNSMIDCLSTNVSVAMSIAKIIVLQSRRKGSGEINNHPRSPCCSSFSPYTYIAPFNGKLIFQVIGAILTSIVDDWVPSRLKEHEEMMLETARIGRRISIMSVSLTNIMFVEYVLSKVSKN